MIGWVGGGPWGPVACALGEPEAALDLVRVLATSGVWWMHLPRIPAAEIAARLPVRHQDDWDYRWTSAAPPGVPGEDRVVEVGRAHDDAVADLLERAFPGTTTRPGDPRIRAWYGVWDGDRLIAAGADRSRGEVGFLAGLAVDPDRRGAGVGAALTAGMMRRLLDEFGVVSLGVMYDNSGAIRLYERLGFTQCLSRSSVSLDLPVDDAPVG